MFCSPYIATIAAGILSLIQSGGGIIWTAELLLQIYNVNTTDILEFHINTNDLNNGHVIIGFTQILIPLYVVWLLFSLMLLQGNVNSKYNCLVPWWVLTMIINIINVAMGIYFFLMYRDIIFSNCHNATDIDHLRKYTLHLKLCTLFSGVFFIFPVINFIFVLYVGKRITHLRACTSRATGSDPSNFTGFPYSALPPPYTE